MSEIADIAAADQELAAIEDRLNLLIAIWRKLQPEYDAAGLDRMHRIGAFMLTDVAPSFIPTGAYAALAVAIERLAAK